MPASNIPHFEYVLDTHIWIWLSEGDARLGKSKVLPAILDSLMESKVCISAISVWELGMLEAKNRIELSMPAKAWVARSLELGNIQVSPLIPPIALDSTSLPGEFHGDPADRIIVATARYHSAKIITCDKLVLAYGGMKHCMAIAP
jgi:PIN domain nuclease of toxin-antitoxin system